MSKPYDVIIVGGGPAGSTAGYLLSKAGFRTLLIDKSKFPRHKLCAGCITNKTIKLLERVFGETAEGLKKKGVINFESSRYEIFSENRAISRKYSPVPFYFVDRFSYDDLLLRKAESSGAEVIEGERVASVDISKNEIQTGSGRKFLARFLIGADGINSVIRRQFPSEAFDRNAWQRGHGSAMEVFIGRSEMQGPVDHPVLYFDFIDHGYTWMFPNKDRLVVGIAGLTLKNRRNFLPLFNDFLSKMNIAITNKSSIKSCAFPYGNFLSRPVFRNIILVGDAAGFADPLLGEGIYYAQRSAELASKAICDLTGEDRAVDKESKKITDKYLQLLSEDIFPEFIYAEKIRKFLFTYLNKHDYLLLKILMSLSGNRPLEAVHGLRSYKWLRRK